MEWREVKAEGLQKPAYVFSDGNNNKLTFFFTRNSKILLQHDVPFLYIAHNNLHSIRFENAKFKKHYVTITANDGNKNRRKQGKEQKSEEAGKKGRSAANQAPKNVIKNIMREFNDTANKAWGTEALKSVKFPDKCAKHDEMKFRFKKAIIALKDEFESRKDKGKVMQIRKE